MLKTCWDKWVLADAAVTTVSFPKEKEKAKDRELL